jgi:hypothetical protein
MKPSEYLQKIIDLQERLLKSSDQATITSFQSGQYVIVRTTGAGVHAGELAWISDRGTVELKNSRRLWKWGGAHTLSELALHGGRGTNISYCQFAEVLPTITIFGAHEVIPCTEKAKSFINSQAIWQYGK